ncbi:methyltransferase domain-containing protein [Coniella lustricola]|uniref:Methyltransferase domain-containing protein n=1 Tax=Coniella lustricola TaxID=2025994 RepID=A0A2T3AGZ2_9PEZI|nr:methyltransferase domain-containing protein [Coniella lustricola]
MSLSPAAAIGFANASAYDAHRPAYPAEAVQKLLKHMRLADRAHARIVEVAAGTGKFTEALAARHEGFDIVATEPHPDMRRQLEARALRRVVVRPSPAQELGRMVDGDGNGIEEWGDGVIAAQAFHWFATDEVLDEIHRVLKPGAVFGMIWNIDDYNKPKAWASSTRWAQHLNDWIHSLGTKDNDKRFRDMKWQEVFEKQLKTNPIQVLRDTVMGNMPRFSVPLGQDSVEWTHWLSEQALWNRIRTLSHVAMLQGADKVEAERVFREAMAMDDVVRNENAEVECHGRTYLAWSDRM